MSKTNIMKTSSNIHVNPELDLVLERIVDVPKELVWKAWTDPKHLVKWFVPRPWTTTTCEIDLRPGGVFRTVMRSPEGVDHDSAGCYLEIIEYEKLVWTSALAPGFRPVHLPENAPGLLFTASISLETVKGGTQYTATAIHGNHTARNTHADMGFVDGWGVCLTQLVECITNGGIQ